RRRRGGGRRRGCGFHHDGRRRRDVAPAERARGVRVQPHVDAAHVEQVPARRQLPHHLAGLDVLQAHRAQRAPPRLASAAAAVVGRRARVRERRERVDRRADEPARRARRRRGRPRPRLLRRRCCRRQRRRSPAGIPAPPRDAADGAEQHRGRRGEHARLGDAHRGGEHRQQQQRRADHDDGVAREVPTIPAALARRRAPFAVKHLQP
ncbi:Os02g0248300, partial [Oryza sativa Japonica Group]